MKSIVAVFIALLLLGSAGAQSRKAKETEKKTAPQSASQQPSAKADINTASESELEAVKGIGPATAKKIIASRPYSSLDDLKKAGLTQARIDKMRESLTVSAGGAASESMSTKSKPATSTSNSSKPAASTGNADTGKKPSLWEKLKGKKTADTSQPAPSSTSSSNTASAPSQNTSTSTSATSPAPGGGNGKVWANKETKVFHREGDRWYGKTKKGEYMTEQEALAAGYRPVKEHKK